MKPSIKLMAAALVLAASPIQAAPTADFQIGVTSVAPDAGFLAAAESLGVAVAPIQGRKLMFPITSGSIDLETAAADILHKNGISLKAGGTTVELRNFIIDTTVAQPVLTGLVVANEQTVTRLPLFKLELPTGIELPLRPKGFFRALTLPGVKLSLTSEAATALNGAFGVSAFAEDFPIGEATVRAYGLRN